MTKTNENLAIRFGLGAIKAVGLGIMEDAAAERKKNGEFKDIYDFATRLDPKSINKKSIEALAKAGAFDCITKNRRQIAESFDILSSYATKQQEEANSSQMSLLDALPEANLAPELRKVEDWNKTERLKSEFEAFGFFLNEHPIDDHISDLKKRGVIFSDKIEREELENDNIVKIAAVVAGSKHRSSARGRFAYLTLSDPYGIFEAMIFDENLITSARDLLIDGTALVLECLIRKDDGGMRISVRNVRRLEDFIKQTPAQEKEFEDIQKMKSRFSNKPRGDWKKKENSPNSPNSNQNFTPKNNSAPQSQAIQTPSTPIRPQIIPNLTISINTKEAIVMLRSILSGKTAEFNSTEFTTISLQVDLDGKNTVIKLPEKYKLTAPDLARIRHVNGVLQVI